MVSRRDETVMPAGRDAMMKRFSFDQMINVMVPLPFSGEANGEGIYCRGEDLAASIGAQPVRDGEPVRQMESRQFDLTGVFCHYCFN